MFAMHHCLCRGRAMLIIAVVMAVMMSLSLAQYEDAFDAVELPEGYFFCFMVTVLWKIRF